MNGCPHSKDIYPCHECTLPWKIVPLPDDDAFGVYDTWFMSDRRGAIGFSPKPDDHLHGFTRYRRVDAERIVNAVNSYEPILKDIESLRAELDATKKKLSDLEGDDEAWKKTYEATHAELIAVQTELERSRRSEDFAREAAEVQNRACAEEIGRREHLEKNWDAMVSSIKLHHDREVALDAENHVLRAALEEERSRQCQCHEPHRTSVCRHCVRIEAVLSGTKK